MDIKKLSKIADSNFLWDYVNQIESDLDPSGNKFMVSPAPERDLTHGHFPYPSVRVTSYEVLDKDSLKEVQEYLESRWAPFVVNNSNTKADFFVVFDAHAKKVLEKMLGLRPVQDISITDARTEDVEVVAELMAKVESALDESAEAYELDPSEIIVDYDGDIDCIRVELPSFDAESIPDIKQTISNVLDGQFYLTESLIEEYPLFYICFDAETADTFNNE